MWLPGGTGDGLGTVEPAPHTQEDALSASTSDHDPIGGLDPSAFAFSRRAWVDATPAGVYDLVSDVSAIARWSPDATEVTYDEGAGPQVGAWFSGRNQRDGRQWSSRSQVVRAEPGSSFAFVVGGAEGGIVRWTWALHPFGRGTVVEQSWQLLRLDPVLGSTRADLEARRDYMADSVEATLVSLARWIAEPVSPGAGVAVGTVAGEMRAG